jgi:hypothetical protein
VEPRLLHDEQPVALAIDTAELSGTFVGSLC